MSDPLEIEVKFFIRDLQKIITRLHNMEARLIQERVLEQNIRFDDREGRLRSERKVLRLRKDKEAIFTFKGPSKNQEGIFSRVEIEFTVQDFELAKKFLESLGYEKIFFYEKYRTTYEFDNCHIMLDEMPYGNFIEIEGNSETSIRSAAKKLELTWGNAIPVGYLALFDRVRTTHPSLDASDLSFTAFRNLIVSSIELQVDPADKSTT